MSRSFRSNQMWAITIPKCELKEFFYLGLVDLSERLVVSQEEHHDKSFHLHIFLDLKEKSKPQKQVINTPYCLNLSVFNPCLV